MFTIEVEVMGKQAWVVLLPGCHFPRDKYYDFSHRLEKAQQFNTREEAEIVLKNIHPVYCPCIHEEESE